MKKVMQKHWYKTTVQECPLCGRGDVYRERIYGDRPKDPYEFYVHQEIYDHCEDL